MADKKIAVHVTNEEQWDEVNEFYKTRKEGPDYNHCKSVSNQEELVLVSSGTCYEINELLILGIPFMEFNEWQARVKGDSMVEKIEVPQAVYDEFKSLVAGGATYGFMKAIDQESDEYPHMYRYLFETESTQVLRQNQLNLAKVMAGEAEFVPIEEKYYWQDKQDRWLGRASYLPSGVDNITTFPDKSDADKITETEIREKTSFDIDKLKKVSE